MTATPEYNLATNYAEMDRLAVQHRMWCLLIGGLVPKGVHRLVEQASSSPAATIIDVGSGSGIWATKMAKTYPNAQVIGLDLVEQTYSNAPQNFSFVQGDVAVTLGKFKGQADIVHCRCVTQHVKDPQNLVRLMADSLKPGGLLLLADGDWVAYDQSKQLVLPVEYDKDTRKVIADGSRSWYAGWLSLAGLGTRSSEYQRIDQLVKGCEDFNEGDSKFCSYYSPINWSGNDITDGEELGKILDVNQRAFLSASKGTLRKIGIPEETIEEWAEHYQEDLDNKHYYNIWYYMTARKSVCV